MQQGKIGLTFDGNAFELFRVGHCEYRTGSTLQFYLVVENKQGIRYWNIVSMIEFNFINDKQNKNKNKC